MTEIALNPAANAALAPQSSAVVDLALWASELDAAYRLGGMLASTDFVPLSLKTLSSGKLKEPDQIAQNVAACILAGKALGLDPMNSIQNIFVVHGRPAMYARTMAALVLAAGHELERVAATERSVVYRGRRAGKTEWQTFEWTIERATKAGYAKNAKYQSDPIAMLTAKCQAEAARVIAPDVLTGIASTSVEEVQLEDLGEGAADVAAAAPALAAVGSTKGRTMRRQQPAAVAPAAMQDAPREADPVDDEADANDEAADKATGELPTVEQHEAAESNNEPRDADDQPAEAEPAREHDADEPRCTTAQQKALGEALTAAGFPNRAAMMLKCTTWTGREIKASKELSESEAVALTGELWEEADGRKAAS
jgi:hypothetical protein